MTGEFFHAIQRTAGLEPTNLQIIEWMIQRNLLRTAVSVHDTTTNRLQHRQYTTIVAVVAVVALVVVVVLIV